MKPFELEPAWVQFLMKPVSFRWLYSWWGIREARAGLFLLGGWLLVAIGVGMYLGRAAFLILVGLLLLGLVGFRVLADLLWFGAIGEEKPQNPNGTLPPGHGDNPRLFRGKRVVG